MTKLFALLHALSARLTLAAPATLGTLARLVFAAVLLGYFWASAATKPGDGLFGILSPSAGAYGQIFPRAAEAVQFDFSQLGAGYRLIAVAGTLAEFLLPALIVAGLMTRMAAIGMIGFVTLQSLTDVYGHGVSTATIGAFFDRDSGSVILDQRAMWGFLLVSLAMTGAGPISLDRIFFSNRGRFG